ncbi:hypothetical protein AXF42_Ash014777 [Apostasia shenzhenica]|uniref:Uncharacterized protein n=1 Tax=Apostasia shenzhenica TaxID=1088818 RepID=A0A2H9ZWB2_9ASPA|nr:hypothetical protein AXF42_Ash014777 [Apostasia shenzhenica]
MDLSREGPIKKPSSSKDVLSIPLSLVSDYKINEAFIKQESSIPSSSIQSFVSHSSKPVDSQEALRISPSSSPFFSKDLLTFPLL